MGNELQKYKYFSRSTKSCLVICGLWPHQQPLIIKKILSFMTIFTTLFLTLAVTNFCFHNAGNVMVLTKGTGAAVSFSSIFMKAYLFLLYHEDIAYLNDFLEKRYLHDMKFKENRLDLLKRISAFYFLSMAYSIMVGQMMFFYAIRPILILRKYGKYVHVLPVVYPFTYEPGGFIHWTLYVVEAAGTFYLWSICMGVDCVFGLYTFQACGEFRILTKKFKNLVVDGNYARNLRDCVQRHHLLINVKYKLEKIFGFIAIWLAISGALSLCSTIFQVSQATETATFTTIIHYFLYFLPKLLQIFTYAWYGTLITIESGACSDSIYYSNWPDKCSSSFKHDIMIVLLQRPLVIVAKGIILVQLDMFTKIVKMSMSYFYLLRAINEAAS